VTKNENIYYYFISREERMQFVERKLVKMIENNNLANSFIV
jgi:hypothetical protein